MPAIARDQAETVVVALSLDMVWEANRRFRGPGGPGLTADTALDGSRCLERIADHATNIAEEVVFLYEAKDIRHADLQSDET